MSASREAYLGAMGIPIWRRRVRRAGGAAPAPDGAESETAAGAAGVASVEPAETGGPSDALDVARLGWDRLAQVVSACTACALHATRTQTVFGVGNREADLLVIGEAPGADEDRQGERQIELIEPKIMLAVGRVSARWLLQSDRPIGTLRGRIYRYGTSEVPLVVTYHPAYLLRSPEAKAKAWQDLCLVKSNLDTSE